MSTQTIGIKIAVEGSGQAATAMKAVAKNVTDVGIAAKAANSASANLVGQLKSMAGVVGGAATVAGFARWIKGAVDAMDAMNDLKDATGASITEIAKLERVARLNGGGIETVGTALIKLNQAISSVDGKNTASIALRELGLEVDKLKKLDPVVQFRELGKALQNFTDNATKGHYILALTGRSARDIAPLLKDYAESTDEAAATTARMTEEAEQFNKNLALLSTNAGDLARQIAGPLVSAVNDLFAAINRNDGDFFAGLGDAINTSAIRGALAGVEADLGRMRDKAAEARAVLEKPFDGGLLEALKRASAQKTLRDFDAMKNAAADYRAELEKIQQYGQGRRPANEGGGGLAGNALRDLAALEAAEKKTAAAAAEAARISSAAHQRTAEEVRKHAEEQRKLSVLTFNFGENESAAEAARLERYASRARDHAAMVERIIDQEWQAATAEAQIIANDLERWEQAQREKQRIADDFNAKQLAEWERTADQIGQSLADALMDGGKDAAEYITSLVRTMVLKPVIEAVTRPIGNAALGALGMGGSGSAFAGGGSSLSMLSGLGGALGTFGTTLGMGASATMAGNSLAALSGAGNMIGAGNVAGGLGMGLGAVAPYLAGAYAIYSIAKSMDKSGTPHMGSVVGGSGPDLSTLWGDGSTILNNYSGGTDAALRGLVGSSTGILNALGGGGYSATARFAADNTDASIGQYQLLRGGQQVGYVGNGTDYAKYSSDAGTGLQSFTADVVRVTREQLDALDLPGWAQDQLDNLAADADLTQLAGVASAIEATITALDNLRDSFGPLGGVFENIAGLSSDALYSLAESAGGLDALGSSLGSFFRDFYDEAEQVEMQTAAMTAALSEVGLALPESRDAFRAVVESLDLTSAAGQEQFGVLMELSGVFAELNPVIEQASGSLADAARIAAGIAQERAGLEQQLLTLQGDTVALRQIERAALDESNRALYDQITALQDQQAATAAMTAIAGERAGLEMELLRLQGDTNAMREIERAALDESNRALYDQITALRDLQAAAAQAAIDTASAAAEAAELARVQEQAAGRLAAAAAKANEPITPDKIKQGATALLWLKQIEDVSAQIKSGAKGEDWRLAYERDNANMNRPGSNIGDRIGLWATGWMVKDEAQRQIREAGAAMADAMDQRLRGITESRRGVDPYMQEQDRLLQDQIDGTQDLIDALDEMRRGMLDLKNELIGGALDPSNPALKYASERDFVTGLGRQALTGDMAAADLFLEHVGGFLQLSQGYNASSTAYAQDFSTMIELLDQIAASMERQQSTASATLRVQQDGLSQVADNTERTAQATDRQARAASVLEQRAIE
jgi:hypothetical protein